MGRTWDKRDDGIMKKKYVKQIDNIIECFNFNDVQSIMKKTDWVWYITHTPVLPSIKVLKECARELLEKAVSHKFASSGGFTAIKIKGRLYLFFGIDSLFI